MKKIVQLSSLMAILIVCIFALDLNKASAGECAGFKCEAFNNCGAGNCWIFSLVGVPNATVRYFKCAGGNAADIKHCSANTQANSVCVELAKNNAVACNGCFAYETLQKCIAGNQNDQLGMFGEEKIPCRTKGQL